jgi:SAM-dependent methyltransferase
MLVTSRSFAEYEAMFDLPAELPARILDCCAGGSGFTAAVPGALAADPAYALSFVDLAAAVREGTAQGGGIVGDHPDDFTWSWYGSAERRDAMRAEAADAFVADRRRRPSRYPAAALPELPFADGAFDLVLCSHLLFTWSDQLDERWHLAALRELARVGAEVRVFPLVVQRTGEPVPFLDAVRRELAAAGIGTQVRPVPYEFQRGGNRMLVLTRPPRTAG